MWPKTSYEVGGVPVVMKELRKAGLMHEDCMTATGRSMGEELDLIEREADGRVIYPVETPSQKLVALWASKAILLLKARL